MESVSGIDHGTHCRCRYQPTVPAITATAVRAVIVPSSALAGCGRAGATPAHGCCGENASAQHVLPGSATRSCLKRNTRNRAKAFPGSGLAIRAVRLGQGLRKTGRAGATPRKRRWRVQAGLSERSLPGSFLAGRRDGPAGPRRCCPITSKPRHKLLTGLAFPVNVYFSFATRLDYGAGRPVNC